MKKEQKDALDSSSSLSEKFSDILNVLNLFKMNTIKLQQDIKQLEKIVKKEIKNCKKVIEQKKNKGKRQPSGFAKPTKVTKELCEFMNKSEGSEIARTEVTRALISYIKEKKLDNGVNGKFIKPDNTLKNLLGIEDGEELTYFTMQKYMNKHFMSKNNIIES
jgi:chromatin remodeling complex protein RSC6